VLQCVAVCRRVLQCDAVCHRVLRCVAVCRSVSQCVGAISMNCIGCAIPRILLHAGRTSAEKNEICAFLGGCIRDSNVERTNSQVADFVAI